jgi:hypothetical protein
MITWASYAVVNMSQFYIDKDTAKKRVNGWADWCWVMRVTK